MAIQRIGGKHTAFLHILVQLIILIHDAGVIRQRILVPGSAQPDQFVSGLFQLRCDHVFLLCHIHSKGNQRRRNIDLIEGSGHAVLASDGRKAEAKLGRISSQQRCERLTPTGGLLAHPAEVFLEGETDPMEISASCYDPGHRFGHGISSAVIRAPGRQIGIKAIAHHRHGLGLSVLYRNPGYHGLCFGPLIFSPIGHQDAAGADGAVEHLHKTLLGADIKIRKHGQPLSADIRNIRTRYERISFSGRNIHKDRSLLMGSVGVEESAAQIHDLFASPGHDQPGILRHNSDRDCFQIFFGGIGQELIYIRRRNDHGHTLLGFGNGDLRSVQTCIFFRNLIQIDLQAGCKFSDGDGHAAGAEVIAFLDDPAYFLSAEHPLDLPFGRRVALLHLGTADLDGGFGMDLGGTGRSSDAVPSGPAAEKNDDIAGV